MMKLSFVKSFIKFSLSGQLRFLVFHSDDISGYHVSLIKCTASKDVATHGLFSIFTIPSNLTDDLFIPCSILVKVCLINKQRIVLWFDRNYGISAYQKVFLSIDTEVGIHLEQLWAALILFLHL